MKSAIKRAVRGWLSRLGYEVRNVSGIPEDPPIPDWMHAKGPQPEDDLIPGSWYTNAIETVTQAHRPARLIYHRRPHGEDFRVKYVASFLDVRGMRILELGPCEGSWSILLEKMGVRENVGIELRPENLAKCLRIKDLHRLDRTSFLGQDIENLYNSREAPAYSGTFDLIFCLGLLYHLPEPAKALRWFRTQAPRLFLGTLYVEPAESRRYLPELFREAESRNGDHVYRGMEYREGGMADPFSGASAMSFWPYESDLIAMLHDAGYSRVEVIARDILNRMPHITLMAE
jgi:SAM-dependent methyltransferase